jgi:hypothetical protein
MAQKAAYKSIFSRIISSFSPLYTFSANPYTVAVLMEEQGISVCNVSIQHFRQVIRTDLTSILLFL